MTEFVSRNIRRLANIGVAAYLAAMTYPVPEYDYHIVAKINENFPVSDYAGPGVVAFMDPDNMEIAMPTRERTPYGSRDHVRFHETLHIYTEMSGGHHDERGFNDMAVGALRHKSGYNFFPFSSY